MNLHPPVASSVDRAFSISTNTCTSCGLATKGSRMLLSSTIKKGMSIKVRPLDIAGHVIAAPVGGGVAQAGDLGCPWVIGRHFQALYMHAKCDSPGLLALPFPAILRPVNRRYPGAKQSSHQLDHQVGIAKLSRTPSVHSSANRPFSLAFHCESNGCAGVDRIQSILVSHR